MTPLILLIGLARCSKGAAFTEPVRISQPRALYYGIEQWLNSGGAPNGVIAQHGYYRERSDCAAIVQAFNIADARREM